MNDNVDVSEKSIGEILYFPCEFCEGLHVAQSLFYFDEECKHKFKAKAKEAKDNLEEYNARLLKQKIVQLKNAQVKEYTLEFRSLRKKILERDNNECQLCNMQANDPSLYTGFGNYRALSIHHIDGNKNNNDRFNLIVLCGACNVNIEFILGRLENALRRRAEERIMISRGERIELTPIDWEGAKNEKSRLEQEFQRTRSKMHFLASVHGRFTGKGLVGFEQTNRPEDLSIGNGGKDIRADGGWI